MEPIESRNYFFNYEIDPFIAKLKPVPGTLVFPTGTIVADLESKAQIAYKYSRLLGTNCSDVSLPNFLFLVLFLPIPNPKTPFNPFSSQLLVPVELHYGNKHSTTDPKYFPHVMLLHINRRHNTMNLYDSNKDQVQRQTVWGTVKSDIETLFKTKFSVGTELTVASFEHGCTLVLCTLMCLYSQGRSMQIMRSKGTRPNKSQRKELGRVRSTIRRLAKDRKNKVTQLKSALRPLHVVLDKIHTAKKCNI